MNINFAGSYNQTSYSLVVRNVMRELVEMGHNINFWSYSTEQYIVEQDNELWNAVTRNIKFPDFHAPHVNVWHQHNLERTIGKGQKVAFSIFELDDFSDVEKHHLSNQDKIIVASQWAKDIISLRRIKVPTYVAQLGVDKNIFVPAAESEKQELRKQIGFNDEDYVFIMSGKHEIRKCSDIVGKIFRDAFPTQKDVRLIISGYNINISEKANAAWANSFKNDDRIFCLDRRLPSQTELRKLFAIADCGLFPSRAEGWNLELGELLCMQKPCIINNCSGHTEMSKYCIAVDPLPGNETAFDGVFFFGGRGKWSRPDTDALVEAMRTCYNKRLRDNPNDFAEHFSWRNTAQKVLTALK